MKEEFKLAAVRQTDIEARRKESETEIKAELKGFGIPIDPEILEHLVVIDINSEHIDDSRMIVEGVENVVELVKDSIDLGVMGRKRIFAASFLHDVGKAGPSNDPDVRLAVAKLFSIKVYGPDSQNQTVEQTLRKNDKYNFSESDIIDMLLYLSRVNVIHSMPMRDFWNKHAGWTKDVLEQSSEPLDLELKQIAASHHMDAGINPYGIENIHDADRVSNEMKFSFLLLTIMDKYEGFRIRSGFSHQESMQALKKVLEQYEDGDEIKALILRAVDQLGSTNSLFPKTLRLQKRFQRKQDEIIK